MAHGKNKSYSREKERVSVLRLKEKVTQVSDVVIGSLETAFDFVYLYQKSNEVCTKRGKKEMHRDFYPFYKKNLDALNGLCETADNAESKVLLLNPAMFVLNYLASPP